MREGFGPPKNFGVATPMILVPCKTLIRLCPAAHWTYSPHRPYIGPNTPGSTTAAYQTARSSKLAKRSCTLRVLQSRSSAIFAKLQMKKRESQNLKIYGSLYFKNAPESRNYKHTRTQATCNNSQSCITAKQVRCAEKQRIAMSGEKHLSPQLNGITQILFQPSPAAL